MQQPDAFQREPWVDALRVLAVLGVFMVNAMGYPFAPNHPIQTGLAQPVDSTSAQWINGMLIAFVMGKAWPLLCFLFGYSLCAIALQARAKGLVVRNILRTRYCKLLLLGVLHGALVYFGDVLTIYAVCGLICSQWVLLRPVALFKIWKRITMGFIGMALLMMMLFIVVSLSAATDETTSLAYNASRTFASEMNLADFGLLNVNAYFNSLTGALFLAPVFIWLTMAGVVARRFRLLSGRHCARAFWSQHLRSWQLHTALAINIALAVYAVQLQKSGAPYELRLANVSMLFSVIGPWLAAALLAWGMRHWHQQNLLPRWAAWLAPAGRHTLAMYLGLSVVLMFSSGAFLGLTGNTAIRLIFVVTAWIAAVHTARFASKRGMRDPLARWLSANLAVIKCMPPVKTKD